MFEAYLDIMKFVSRRSVFGEPVTRYAVVKFTERPRALVSDLLLRLQEFGAIDEYSRATMPTGKVAIYYSVSIRADRDIEDIGVEGVSEWVAHMLCRDDILYVVNNAIVEGLVAGGKISEVRKMILAKRMQTYMAHTVAACAIKPSQKMDAAAKKTYQEVMTGLDNMDVER